MTNHMVNYCSWHAQAHTHTHIYMLSGNSWLHQGTGSVSSPGSELKVGEKGWLCGFLELDKVIQFFLPNYLCDGWLSRMVSSNSITLLQLAVDWCYQWLGCGFWCNSWSEKLSPVAARHLLYDIRWTQVNWYSFCGFWTFMEQLVIHVWMPIKLFHLLNG